MSKKPNLAAFMASKANATPAPLDYSPPTPANQQPRLVEPTPAPPEVAPSKVAEESVPMTFRVEKSFRKMLKQYAASLEKPMVEVIREGIELHRQKHGKVD